jgi:hypothetical protein
MADARRWYTEPETFVAVAALIVSLSALGVGVYEASLQRDHDRAEVWPNLEVEVFAGNDGAKIQAENTGLGPAVVQSIAVSVDGHPQHSWPGVLAALTGDSVAVYDNHTVYRHSIRPGDRVSLFGLAPQSMPASFWNQMKRVVIAICYRSVFDQRWLVVDTVGVADHQIEVGACPDQVSTADF